MDSNVSGFKYNTRILVHPFGSEVSTKKCRFKAWIFHNLRDNAKNPVFIGFSEWP